MQSIIKIYLVFFLTIGSSEAQSDKSSLNRDSATNEMSCEYGTNHAVDDLNKGIIKQRLFGPGEDVSLTLVLKCDYGIEVKSIGCFVSEADQCYNAKMNLIIYEKYGTDIYEKAKEKAEKMVEKMVEEIRMND